MLIKIAHMQIAPKARHSKALGWNKGKKALEGMRASS